MNGRTDVVVVGGGYAGVMAANRLTRRDDVDVTLINPRARFVQRIRLHQLVGETHAAVADYETVLARRVRRLTATVTRIDAAARLLELAGGATVDFDYLVYAVGSATADLSVPGAADFAFPVSTLEQAECVREALAAVPIAEPIVVVGGGATGIEVATELAGRGRRVTLVCGRRLNPYLHPRSRRWIAAELTRLGVEVLEGPGLTVTAVTARSVRLADGDERPSRLTVWAAGFGVPGLARESGLATDELGRLLTDETLTSLDDERILAAGDCAAPSALPVRMSCQAAQPMGLHAAETVLDRIAGERPRTLPAAFVGQCISLGRHSGVVQLARRDDTATVTRLTGRAGAAVKELVCRGVDLGMSLEARRPGMTPLHLLSDPGRPTVVRENASGSLVHH